MAYFKINDVDYSMYVNSLKVNKNYNYNAQTNASGNTVVDLINSKYTVEVGIIPLDDTAMTTLQTAIDNFNVSISFLDPKTKILKSINCIVPSGGVEYYTIQLNKVMYKAFTIQFIEL